MFGEMLESECMANNLSVFYFISTDFLPKHFISRSIAISEKFCVSVRLVKEMRRKCNNCASSHAFQNCVLFGCRQTA